MRISDWSSDVCSSDLHRACSWCVTPFRFRVERAFAAPLPQRQHVVGILALGVRGEIEHRAVESRAIIVGQIDEAGFLDEAAQLDQVARAFEIGRAHSELQSLMRISYAVFCLKKKIK